MMLMRLFSESALNRRPLANPLLFMQVRNESMSAYEIKVADLLRSSDALGNPSKVVVEDRSGGCGANFYIMVESNAFAGVPRIRQHRMIQEVLKEEIAKWHAVSIESKTPTS